jgi:hypothetical protein
MSSSCVSLYLIAFSLQVVGLILSSSHFSYILQVCDTYRTLLVLLALLNRNNIWYKLLRLHSPNFPQLYVI